MKEFPIGEIETKLCAGARYDVALNYAVQAQQCDLVTCLTEEMKKYPKHSPERSLLKAIRLGVAFGKGDQTITIHTDKSSEEMMTRFKSMFKEEEQNENNN